MKARSIGWAVVGIALLASVALNYNNYQLARHIETEHEEHRKRTDAVENRVFDTDFENADLTLKFDLSGTWDVVSTLQRGEEVHEELILGQDGNIVHGTWIVDDLTRSVRGEIRGDTFRLFFIRPDQSEPVPGKGLASIIGKLSDAVTFEGHLRGANPSSRWIPLRGQLRN